MRHKTLVVVLPSSFGGGFFLAREDIGGRFNKSFPACAISVFVFNGDQLAHIEISFRTLVALFRS